MTSARRRPPVATGVVAGVLAAAALAGCAADSAATSLPTGQAVEVPAPPAASVPPTPLAGVGGLPVGPPDEPPPGGDVTRAYAEQLVPVDGTPVPAPGAALPVVAGVDYTDPLSVARAYVTARWTYDSRDPAGYTAALTAPALTTAAFAARSSPSPTPAAVAVIAETATVQVSEAAPLVEAPGSDTTAYVEVPFRATVTHPGAPHGQPLEQAWQLRLTRDPATPGWRVDAVLATH